MKVLYIEGCTLDTVEMEEFSIDAAIDKFEINREELKECKEDDYMDGATLVTEEFTETHHVIIMFNYVGEASFLIRNL